MRKASPHVCFSAIFASLEQGHEELLEGLEVLVHVELDVAADEAADGLDAQRDGGVHELDHPVVLDLAQLRVADQHVVEVADVGEADAVLLERGLDALHAALVERLEDVQVVRDRVEHRLGRDVGQLLGEGGGDLEALDADLGREGDPLLDGEVGVLAALVARGQFLQRRRQDAQLHVLGLELDAHDLLPS